VTDFLLEKKVANLDRLNDCLACEISGRTALRDYCVSALDDFVQFDPCVKRFANNVAGVVGITLDVFEFGKANSYRSGFVCCQRFVRQGGLGPLELVKCAL
jgi:hypothetical protein